MSANVKPPTIGGHFSIPTPERDCVVITGALENWFEWKSLTRDARGTYPLTRMSECWPLCEHMNDERVCAECVNDMPAAPTEGAEGSK